MATNTTAISNNMQTYFDRKLLQHAVQELRLNEFAELGDLPQKVGSKTIRYFRRRVADEANVQTLVEGDPSGLVEHGISYDYVESTLIQVGDVHKITDVAGMVAIFNLLTDSVACMGEEAALKADSITRNAVVAGITAAGQKRYSQRLADYAALAAATAAQGKAVETDFLDACTQLKIKRAPKFGGGNYACVLPPQVSHSIFDDGTWVDVSKYAAAEQIFKGEIGRWRGIRFVEATNPFIESSAGSEGTYAGAGNIFTSIITGKGGFGVPKMAGTSSPAKPQVIVLNQADKSDPLNQKVNVGWKAFYNALVLNSTWVVTMRSKTEFA